jgi:uncharacterized protein
MLRLIEERLKLWKDEVGRMPLLVRGARQVGKSYILEKFGRENFGQLVTINFERRPDYKQAFTSLEPIQICNKLALLSKQPIEPGKTLLFLDEIQECPEAISALRYFKEEMPELHVIGAGSLLEFTLNDAQFRMPVGRVQFYYLKPLSFKEFLLASGNNILVEHLAQATPQSGIEPVIHEHALELLRHYLVLGGLPAVIQHYLDTENLVACQERQANLLMTYRSDFGKYANQTKHKYLQAIFERAPGLVGQHFKYADIDPHMQARDLKQALLALRHAGLLYQVFCTQASGLPLISTVNEKKFKLLFLDTGLVQHASHLSADLLLQKDLFTINRGHVIEQFVGQELLTLSEFFDPGEIFYWERNTPGSTAEIDYVIHVDSRIVPIEVKAGTTGRLKSLRIFMTEKSAPLGVHISQKPLARHDDILSIPLYMLYELPRLVRQC